MLKAKDNMRVLFVVRYTGDEYLGIMSISGVLKVRGYKVEMVEAEYEKVKERLEVNNTPTILAYSTPTVFANYYLNLNLNNYPTNKQMRLIT